MTVNLQPLGRFISPHKVVNGTYETQWSLTAPWKPSGVGGNDWSYYEKLPASASADLIDSVVLKDTNENVFPLLEFEDESVEYFAHFTTFSNGVKTCACVDFPEFTGSVYAPTNVSFVGSGTSDGITAINFTYNTVELHFRGINPGTGNPEIQNNSFLTARNGYMSEYQGRYYCEWKYDNKNRIYVETDCGIITGIYGYYSSNRRAYYARAQYNNQKAPNDSLPWMASIKCPAWFNYE